jgi:hypothetical protein
VANTLVSTSDLMDFPGSPFQETRVDIAAASVRSDAGWHIAPVVTETITVRSYGGRELLLPSRRVVSVASVGTLTDWVLQSEGVLYRHVGWPVGVLEVTFTHGFGSVPVELLPVLAARAAGAARLRDPAVSATSVGQVQVSYRDTTATIATDPVIARYSVRVGVA